MILNINLLVTSGSESIVIQSPVKTGILLVRKDIEPKDCAVRGGKLMVRKDIEEKSCGNEVHTDDQTLVAKTPLQDVAKSTASISVVRSEELIDRRHMTCDINPSQNKVSIIPEQQLLAENTRNSFEMESRLTIKHMESVSLIQREDSSIIDKTPLHTASICSPRLSESMRVELGLDTDDLPIDIEQNEPMELDEDPGDFESQPLDQSKSSEVEELQVIMTSSHPNHVYTPYSLEDGYDLDHLSEDLTPVKDTARVQWQRFQEDQDNRSLNTQFDDICFDSKEQKSKKDLQTSFTSRSYAHNTENSPIDVGVFDDICFPASESPIPISHQTHEFEDIEHPRDRTITVLDEDYQMPVSNSVSILPSLDSNSRQDNSETLGNIIAETCFKTLPVSKVHNNKNTEGKVLSRSESLPLLNLTKTCHKSIDVSPDEQYLKLSKQENNVSKINNVKVDACEKMFSPLSKINSQSVETQGSFEQQTLDKKSLKIVSQLLIKSSGQYLNSPAIIEITESQDYDIINSSTNKTITRNSDENSNDFVTSKDSYKLLNNHSIINNITDSNKSSITNSSIEDKSPNSSECPTKKTSNEGYEDQSRVSFAMKCEYTLVYYREVILYYILVSC